MRAEGAVCNLDDAPLNRSVVSGISGAIIQPASAERLLQRRQVEFAYGIDGVARFRVSAYSQRGSLVLQFRKVTSVPPVLEDLALPTGVQVVAKQPRGVVMVAGPPGSGRTTTLHAIVDYLNRSQGSFIVTVEEPVEVLHTDLLGTIVQLEVGRDVTDVKSGVRTAVRQDADVVMVGMLDNSDVGDACLLAADAGLLVVAGMEGGTAREATHSFVRLWPEHERERIRLRLAGALAGVIAQRLLPRRAGTGRVAAAEVRLATTEIRQAVVTAESTGNADDGEADSGWGRESLEQALADLCAAGVIDLRTALIAAPRWDLLNERLERHGLHPVTPT